MYINDVHILIYIVFLILGAVIGQLTDWVCKRIVEDKKIFSKEIINEYKNKKRFNYKNISIISVLYIIMLFRFGIKPALLENLDLIKFLFLIPILISIMQIDYKHRIIPNRLVLTIFEGGISFAFLYALNNLFVARDYFFGMIVGAVIFAIIAALGRLIAGKEAMGMGDIKLMTTLGLFFGVALIVSISILSFIIAGILSGIIIAVNKKKKNNKKDEYITFGPCIGMATILCIIVPEKEIISVLLTVFTLGKYKV